MQEFKKISVSQCFCGSLEFEENSQIKKIYNYGEISFIKCLNCHSFIQSPKLTIGSLVDWYNSLDYSSAHKTKNSEGPYLDYFADEELRKQEYSFRFKKDLEPYLGKNSELLEVGCATGSFLFVLKEQGFRVLGIDISSVFIGKAKELYSDIQFICGDFLKLDLPNDKFDCIILLGTISNLYNIDLSLAKLNSLLKKGGLLYFNFVPCDTFLVGVYRSKHWMFTPSVINFFSKKGIYSLLEKNNFSVTKYGVDYQKPSLQKILKLSKLYFLIKFLAKIGLLNKSLPLPLPIPGVYSILAQKK